MQTFDFLPTVWKSEELKQKLYNLIEAEAEKEIMIGVYILTFDFQAQVVMVHCHDPRYLFYSKIIPVEMPISVLVKLIGREFGDGITYKVL